MNGLWRAPVALGVVTTVGLLMALFADGLADYASTALLSIPVGVCFWCGYIRR